MAGDRPNVLSSAELKRRGIAAIEEALQASQAPVPEISSLEWLLQQPPSTTGRTKAEIDAELSEERNW
jgi:hypothetical protein